MVEDAFYESSTGQYKLDTTMPDCQAPREQADCSERVDTVFGEFLLEHF